MKNRLTTSTADLSIRRCVEKYQKPTRRACAETLAWWAWLPSRPTAALSPPSLPAPRPAPPAVPKVLDAHASSSPGGVGAELLHPGTCEPVFFAEAGGKEGFSCGPVPAVRLSAGPMQTRPLPPPSGKWQTRAEPPWTLHGHFFLTSDRRWKRAITWGLRGAAGQRPSADVPGSLSMQSLLRKGGLG